MIKFSFTEVKKMEQFGEVTIVHNAAIRASDVKSWDIQELTFKVLAENQVEGSEPVYEDKTERVLLLVMKDTQKQFKDVEVPIYKGSKITVTKQIREEEEYVVHRFDGDNIKEVLDQLEVQC